MTFDIPADRTGKNLLQSLFVLCFHSLYSTAFWYYVNTLLWNTDIQCHYGLHGALFCLCLGRL